MNTEGELKLNVPSFYLDDQNVNIEVEAADGEKEDRVVQMETKKDGKVKKGKKKDAASKKERPGSDLKESGSEGVNSKLQEERLKLKHKEKSDSKQEKPKHKEKKEKRCEKEEKHHAKKEEEEKEKKNHAKHKEKRHSKHPTKQKE